MLTVLTIVFLCINIILKYLNSDGLPYYFIVYDEHKYSKKISEYLKRNKENINGRTNKLQKPKHYLDNNNDLNSFENDYYGKKQRRKEEIEKERKRQMNENYITKVSAWYPQPGKDNVFHCLVLFSYFLDKFCDEKLINISLKDQNCDLLLNVQGRN